jgi:hypothetical protein
MTNWKLSASVSAIREAVSRRRISLNPRDSGDPRELLSVHDRRTSKKYLEWVLCGAC